MTPQLFSIDQSPRSVPAWELIIDDLGRPPAERIATVLGVSRSTVYRWQQAGSGPRIACLALFWLTRWGRSAVHTQATNDAVLYVQLARAMTDERDKLARKFELLEREHHNLQFDFATAQLAQPSRGSGATAERFHTGTAPSGSSAAASVQPGSMSWPALGLDAAADARLTREHPGTHEALPPEARSARCPATERSPQPQPSASQEVVQSSPWPGERCQSDAIVASVGLAPPRLVLDGTSPPARGAVVGAAALPPTPSACGLEPTSWVPAGASAKPPPCPTSIKSNAAGHGAQGTTEKRHGPPHASDFPGAPPTEGLLLSEGLRPLSAAGREPALSWGSAPYPPPMAASAPPGQGVFAALVRAATGAPATLCSG